MEDKYGNFQKSLTQEALRWTQLAHQRTSAFMLSIHSQQPTSLEAEHLASPTLENCMPSTQAKCFWF